MEKHKCKLCFRKFANGRALGGHVRSHKMNLYPPQNPKFLQEHEIEDEKEEEEDESSDSWFSSTSFTSSSSLSSEEEDEQEEDQDLKKNTFMMNDHEFKNGVHQTKRIRSSRISGTATNQLRNFKKDTIFMLPNCEKEENPPLMEAEEEEDLAYCLMLLSRDKWEKTVCLKDQESRKSEQEEEEDNGVRAKVSRFKTRRKYICESCDKVFKSYQALGGHRASHKKIKLTNLCVIKEDNTNVVMKKKLHECPICFKVFSSGQALGGHKRSHNTISSLNLSSSCSYGTNNNKVSLRFNGEKPLIDLNLPPPIDDEEDDFSQVEQSNPIKL